MNIYKVSTCKFTEAADHSYITRLAVDKYVDHFCTFDCETNIATDLFSQEQFYVLKKSSNNRILQSEVAKINFVDSFGVRIEKLKLKSLSRSEQIQLGLAYYKYQILSRTKGKQKVIKR